MKTNNKKRVNITLPKETLENINKVSENGNRSRFIDRAVRFYIQKIGRKNLKEALKEGALNNSERDKDIAAEWFNVDEGAWQKTRN